jgi:DTW domain-containing protein YfiP
LPVLAPATRIVVLAHRIELTKSTNTGRLVAGMLRDRAELAQSHCWEPELDPHGTFVLFPSDDALPLEEVRGQVRCLIVPDGTWAQGRRIARRHVRCRELQKVRLLDPPASRYALRHSVHAGGLCTLEAVAHALRALEGDALPDAMLEIFALWVQRALLVRAGSHDMRELPAFSGER